MRYANFIRHKLVEAPAFHGTPHRFDQFSTDKIGAGEGAQAYGWGLYFADSPAVAQGYRDTLTHYRPDHVQNALIRLGISPEMAEGFAAFYAEVGRGRNPYDKFVEIVNEPSPNEFIQEYRNRMKAELPKLKAALGQIKGMLYTVDIPEDDDYLLWDAPLSQQTEKVKLALKRFGIDSDTDPEHMDDTELLGSLGQFTNTLGRGEATGKKLYRELASHFGSDKAASLALLKAGVQGIKYLDGNSRKVGEGTYNYVVFDANRVAIRNVE